MERRNTNQSMQIEDAGMDKSFSFGCRQSELKLFDSRQTDAH